MIKETVYYFPFHAIMAPRRIHILTQEQDHVDTAVCPSDVDSLTDDDMSLELLKFMMFQDS
jgi:hypothetical protein